MLLLFSWVLIHYYKKGDKMKRISYDRHKRIMRMIDVNEKQLKDNPERYEQYKTSNNRMRNLILSLDQKDRDTIAKYICGFEILHFEASRRVRLKVLKHYLNYLKDNKKRIPEDILNKYESIRTEDIVSADLVMNKRDYHEYLKTARFVEALREHFIKKILPLTIKDMIGEDKPDKDIIDMYSTMFALELSELLKTSEFRSG